ncbi:fumarylacetoacetate hydrolase family protein [Pararobbsia silviterrae]|uniref:FAA hydrolase family protein n=1 Tax=Pararobbsia silviterrae TaxID=1792498 RepID=A0A494Y4Y5_9BURK|nr:fumarylacetoacetate hydrolase family protein [Pararobbsia silviterrae]RKP56573.1 FAA hydrolase family protein [Pararobbsia silviterrae]
MKLACFNHYRVGVVVDAGIVDVTHVLPDFLDALPAQRLNWLIGHWSELESKVAAAAERGAALAPSDVNLLAANPGASQMFAAPVNYRKHIGELGDRAVVAAGRTAREQGFFLKATGSLIGSGSTIRLPKGSQRRFDHESELAVIIGREARDVPREHALEHVFGYACLIDGTMRIEKGHGEEERTMRKSFDTFTPLGPYVVTADEVGDAGALSNRLWVNGELRQSASTQDMIVGIAELIEMISSVVTLRPGDVIATGTPDGVGPIHPGDTVTMEIERVGRLSVSVGERESVSPRAY